VFTSVYSLFDTSGDNLILKSDSATVISSSQPVIDPDTLWQNTPYTNRLRYKPSQIYFARLRVKGKLIRCSLKTDSITVANLRLADLEKTNNKKPIVFKLSQVEKRPLAMLWRCSKPE